MNSTNDDESLLGGPLELPTSSASKERPTSPHDPKKKIGKVILIIFAIILAAASAGYGSWKFFSHKPSDATNNTGDGSESTQKNADTTPTKTSEIADVTGTKTFKSDALHLELIHPTSWTTTEAGGGVRVESPDFDYQTTTQGIVKGNFRIYIRQGARVSDSKYIGAGVATQDSEKITYSQPTSGQRKETNLSFFGIDSPDHFAYMFVAGNYSLKKGDTLGPNYGKETDTYIVMGGYSVKSLTDDFATNKIALETFKQSNAYKQALDIIKSLKLF